MQYLLGMYFTRSLALDERVKSHKHARRAVSRQVEVEVA